SNALDMNFHNNNIPQARRRGWPRLSEVQVQQRQQERLADQAQRNIIMRLNNRIGDTERAGYESTPQIRDRRLCPEPTYVGGIPVDKNISPHYIGKMDFTCIHCGARNFEGEKVSNKGSSF